MRRKPIAVTLAVAAGVSAITVALASRRARSAPMQTGRVARTAQMARMGAATGSSYASMRARSVVASPERKEELREEFELRSAEQVAAALGGMKGAMMKLGQMASYLDQGLPEPVRDALAQLQSDAPPMAYELVADVVTAELGAPPEEVFASFDRQPLASASIGQVHRARTHEGVDVVVKVQYPGVGEAIEADLGNTEFLFQLLGMLFPGMDPAPIVEELRDRVIEELDYANESDNQQRFADAYRDHPYFHVPDVLRAYSTPRLLTSEFVDGARFAEVLEWPEHERQLTAESLYRFAFGGIYQLHAFNGDPHPGNYLFHPGGRITFLDFGLCKRFTPEEVDAFERMIQAMVIDYDVAAFRQVVEDIGVLSPTSSATDEEVQAYFGHFYELVDADEVRRITPEYSSESVRRFFDLSGPHAEIMKEANLPPSMVIVQRINLGLYALFGDLGAENNWRRIAEELWPMTASPPSTPMGERILEWQRARGPAGSAETAG